MHSVVSVVIPVYNKEKYVARSIQSVLDQSHMDVEVLIIDDAATDRSLERVAEFEDPRIKVLSRTISGPGGYAARNLGIQHATGDWISFLDADDCWQPDHLEKALAIADQYPDIPIISAARINQFGSNQKLDPYGEHFINDGPQVLYLSDYLRHARKGRRAMQTNTLLIKRDALFSHMIFPEGRTDRSGDLYAWVQLLARLKIMVWSPHVAAVSYRDVIGVSRTSTPSIQLFREMVDELSPCVSDNDLVLIRNYANTMIKYAWLEKKKKRISMPILLLPASLFWVGDVSYCLKWTMISILPFGVLEWMHKRFLTE